MKKTQTHRRPVNGEMKAEYRFDYSKSKPNRFASQIGPDTIAVVLEPDVAKVFHSSDTVNAFLRSAIAAVAASGKPQKA